MSCATQSVAVNKPKAIRKVLLAEISAVPRTDLAHARVCEATGGYERHVLAICLELGVAVHRAHGSRVRYFARYLACSPKPIRSTLAFLRFMGSRPPIFASMFRRR